MKNNRLRYPLSVCKTPVYTHIYCIEFGSKLDYVYRPEERGTIFSLTRIYGFAAAVLYSSRVSSTGLPDYTATPVTTARVQFEFGYNNIYFGVPPRGARESSATYKYVICFFILLNFYITRDTMIHIDNVRNTQN